MAVSEVYLSKLKAFIVANRLQIVDDDERARQSPINTVPWVDPRSLIFSPSVDVEDSVRDAVLLKLAGYTSPTSDLLEYLWGRYVDIKVELGEEFVRRYLKEVKRR